VGFIGSLRAMASQGTSYPKDERLVRLTTGVWIFSHEAVAGLKQPKRSHETSMA
jgi:hypothetical protein